MKSLLRAAGLFALTNIVYIPELAAGGACQVVTYSGVFLVLVALWCLAAHFIASRPVITRALGRWVHIRCPAVLIGFGVLILAKVEVL